MNLALAPDRRIRLRHRLAQAVPGPSTAEGGLQCLDGHARRDLSTGVSPHPVGHRAQVRALERHVLVDGADPADVGGRAGSQLGHRATSKTVEPTCSWSPLPRRMAWAICSELTNVPLVEPRSSTQS